MVPVFVISRMPKPSSISMRAAVLSRSPKMATVRASRLTSMMLARKMLAIWMTSSRVFRSPARTLMRATSRRMELFSSKILTAWTQMSLRHWAAIWSIISSSPMMLMVSRAVWGRSLSPVTMDSMLYPFRENSRATWLSTPGVSSVRMHRVYSFFRASNSRFIPLPPYLSKKSVMWAPPATMGRTISSMSSIQSMTQPRLASSAAWKAVSISAMVVTRKPNSP